MDSLAAPQSSNQDALKWLASKAQWLDRSSDTCFGLAPVYVLCLDERIAHVRQFLEKNGIEGRVSIVRAFTPEEVDLQEFIDRGIVDAEFIKGRDRKKRVLELCFSLGHLAIALDSQLTGSDGYLCFEDDLEVQDYREPLSLLLKSGSSFAWDLFYFSYCLADTHKSRSVTGDLLQLRGQLCANAYAVRRHACDALLSAWLPIYSPPDIYLRDFAETEDLLVLGAAHRIFNQDRFSIASTFGNGREVPPPKWRPHLRQKLLARARALLNPSDPIGYDKALYEIDQRRGSDCPDGPTHGS